MKKLLVITTAIVAPLLFAGSALADEAEGTGRATGEGTVQGEGYSRGSGTATGEGVVLYRDADGTLRYRQGTGTVEGRGLAIGEGTTSGEGRATGTGEAAGEGSANTTPGLQNRVRILRR